MGEKVVIRGHVVGSTTVELDEPLPAETTDVEVVVHVRAKPGSSATLGEYVRSLPPGHRTQEDIDRQIEEERGSWRD